METEVRMRGHRLAPSIASSGDPKDPIATNSTKPFSPLTLRLNTFGGKITGRNGIRGQMNQCGLPTHAILASVALATKSNSARALLANESDTSDRQGLEPDLRTLTLIIIVSVVLGVIATVVWFPQTVAAEAQSVGALGVWLSGWGLALSAIGFGLTWWQLSRSRSAAKRVAAALVAIRGDYASFDIIGELRTAKAAGEDAQASLEGERWIEAIQAFNRVRVSLVKMSATNGGLNDANTSLAKDYAGDMLTSCDVISENRAGSPDEIPKNQMIANLRILDNFLITLEQELKGGIGGNQH
jgi:hypothetical protein